MHLVNPTAVFHSLLLLLLKRGIKFWNFCEFISIAGAFRAIFLFRNFWPCNSILRGEILLKNFCNFQFFYWFCRLRTKINHLFFIKDFFEPKQNLTCFMYILCPQKENGIGSDKWPNLFQLYMSKQERTSTISNDKDHKTTLVFSVSDLKLFLYNMNHTEAKYFYLGW